MKKSILYLLLSVVFFFLAFLSNKINIQFLDDKTLEIRGVGKRLEREYRTFKKDFQRVKMIIVAEGLGKSIPSTQYPFYIYRNNKLVVWSDHHLVPDYDEISWLNGPRIINLEENVLLAEKEFFVTQGDTLTWVGIIPIFIQYPYSNTYLQSGLNPDIFKSKNFRLSEKETEYQIDLGNQSILNVSISGSEGYLVPYIQIVFFAIGLLYLLIVIVRLIKYYNSKDKYATGFLVFSFSLILIRLLMISFNLPFSILKIDFFDPRFYASSYINPSFGDLFLNIIVIWAITFYFISYYHKISFIRKLLRAKGLIVDIAAIVLLSFVFFGGFFIYKLIHSISMHSQWTLDITDNLDFDVFRLSSYLLFFIATISYIQITSVTFNLLFRISSGKRFLILFSSYFTGILILFYLFGEIHVWIFAIIGLYIVIIRYFNIPGKLLKEQYTTFLFFASTTMLSSLLGALAIYYYQMDNVYNEKERYARRLLQQNDFIAEYYLAEAMTDIRDDAFIQGRLQSAFSSKDIIRDKIRRVYLSNYFEKYDINILLFNSRGQPFDSNITLDYHEFKRRYALPELKTEYPNIFLINARQPGLPTRYLGFLEIERYSTVIGYIIINLRLKRVIPANVFPRLLMDDRFGMYEVESSFGYIMYKNGRLISQSGEHDLMGERQRLLSIDKLYTKGVSIGNNSYLGFREGNDTVVLISSEKYSLRKTLGNFSFLFSTFSLVSLLVLVLMAVVYQLRGRNLNYATRIQLFLNIAFIVPLIAVSITTLTRLTRNYSNELDKKYRETAENLALNISPYLVDYFDDEDRRDREELAKELSTIASIAECDINLYGVDNLKGKLITTTQPLIFDKGILSEYINPLAAQDIYSNIRNQVVLNERVGRLRYKSAYTAIQSAGTGALLGILSIPFFSSKEEIDARISDLLVNILNIFTIIFILFLIISYFTSFYLIQPLRLLIQKIRRTSLEGENEPLKYKSNDEIGQIVNEYNKMLIKLEESREALARTEKESAWREMARQVAHEIKNPLTPMKLTIQHLAMRINKMKDPESAMLEKSLNSLLYNIETLSGIASSFSTYAQMPVPEIEEFDVVGLLRKTTNIYSNKGEARILLDLPKKEIKIKADPNWLGRAFSNLIINGIQAVENEKEAVIQIKLNETEDSSILISIEDNGSGIAEDLQDKIFMPNFSTKYSGSGIGLAVAKRAVDHAAGKIWFETRVGTGTTFFVELPLSG